MYTPKNEEGVLKLWEEKRVFKRSIQERPEDQPYVFYDGPPFATGLPHYGHIVGSVMKDVVPRFWTMQGKRVERVWGWDCHGLPIENIVEKELGTQSKQDVEKFGVEKFNELCRTKVLSYVAEWEKVVYRLGRWVDMKHAYRTMDLGYMESVWWVFKQLWDKGLIYKGYKPMHICPRCETTLSQQEVSEGYKEIKDLSVTARFKLVSGAPEGVGDVYALAWTTTPWTLPGNVLLAVGEKMQYALVLFEGDTYIVAKELVMANFDGKAFEVVGHVMGANLVGATYEPLFPYFADAKDSFRIVAADFVEDQEGTGIVHLAPAFGTDDYEVFKKEGVPFIQHVKMDGTFTEDVTDFAGMHVKPSDDHMKTDVEIVKWLAHHGRLFSKQKYEHSYPHCWRCDTPLINYAANSWFVAVENVKSKALELAKDVHWSPEHIKEGRFGNWLEGARDWSISRQRFWASVMPVWECESGKCEYVVVGSVDELEKHSGERVDDLHKHVVDEITFPCGDCGGKMSRIPDVLDTWFDSGSMPYAQVHYPFENKAKFEESFPAEFIAEGQDQTRAWFYYLHVLATAIMEKPAYQHVIVNGIVLAEDGKKMSKKLKNYPDPNKVLEQYGADALRFYLMSSPVVAAQNLNFAEEGVREVFSKVVNTLWNVLEFYTMFAAGEEASVESDHVLDIWILSRLAQTNEIVTREMKAYRLHEASRPLMEFIQDLSQRYVRCSRDRMKGNDAQDKAAALATMRQVLHELSLLLAPVTPFIAEQVYQETKPADGADSVHLAMWPDAGFSNPEILEDMETIQEIWTVGHSLRKKAQIRTRQPLESVIAVGMFSSSKEHIEQYQDITAKELNIKEVKLDVLSGSKEQMDHLRSQASSHILIGEDSRSIVALNTEISDELRAEGVAREFVRAINGLRKKIGLTREDRVSVVYDTPSKIIADALVKHQDMIQAQTLADSFEQGSAEEPFSVDGEEFKLTITKAY